MDGLDERKITNHIKNNMKRIFIFFMAMFAAMTVFGQNQLPNDSAVRKGKLENGLTYYIRHNDKPENRAEFYLELHD